MRVLLSHYLFGRAGGGERLMATLVDELLKNGTSISMATLSRSDYSGLFSQYFDSLSSGSIRDYWLLPFHLPALGIFQRLLAPIPTWMAMKSSKPDVVFLDHEMFKPLRHLARECKVVWFCHFPYVVWALQKLGKEGVPEKYLAPPWSIYWRSYLTLQRLVVIEEDFADVTMVNSSYTARYVERIWNTTPIVVHPPVNLESFDPSKEKRDLVVSVGRFTPEKRYEDALKAMALCKTSSTLVLVGTLTPSCRPYLHSLREMAKRLGIHKRVHFVVNASFDQLRMILARSKIYVHCMKNEHFGISIAEAMASGCVPVVPKSGGCWEDIVSEGNHGFGWDMVTELAEILDDLLTNDRKRIQWKRIALERSRIFDEAVFRRKMRRHLLNR